MKSSFWPKFIFFCAFLYVLKQLFLCDYHHKKYEQPVCLGDTVPVNGRIMWLLNDFNLLEPKNKSCSQNLSSNSSSLFISVADWCANIRNDRKPINSGSEDLMLHWLLLSTKGSYISSDL